MYTASRACIAMKSLEPVRGSAYGEIRDKRNEKVLPRRIS